MFEAVRRPLEVMFPPEKAVAKRLVEEAVVLNIVVVVALVEVEFRAVKFWRVVDPWARILPEVVRPVTVRLLPTVSRPFALMERVGVVEVAKVEGEDVAR